MALLPTVFSMFGLLSIVLIVISIVALAGLWLPKLRTMPTWEAMTTPLASIIGSGFLILGPILNHAFGMYAPIVMAVLCVVAYLFGCAVRYNIAGLEENGHARGWWIERLETSASAMLGFAYAISVAYYLNLFGSFGVNLTPFDSATNGRILTTIVFAVILVVGWTRGFKALESMEYVSVSVKLAVIAALLVALAIYFSGHAFDGGLHFNPPRLEGWHATTLVFGLIITIQGFETSRYLGDEYDAETRIRSMKWAQWLSAGIYMVYVGLLVYVFRAGEVKLSETAIIDMIEVVAPILPFMLVAAALTAQFSAAVADTGGAGGLVEEISGNRIDPKLAYAVLAAIGIFLTWTLNVFEIVSYASRAFAAYYMIQSAIAARIAYRKRDGIGRIALFSALALLGAMIVIFGQPVENGSNGI